MIQGLINLNNRLRANGGNQEGRMQKDKLRSMQKALLYSYQAADIIINENQYRCLINPDKIKQDYDDKIISIEFSSKAKSGDVFHWINTDTYWIIYLTNLEEDSYFRGAIRRCRYDIQYILDEKIYTTKAAVRGPVETKIIHNLKSNVSYDQPNHTLNILMPATESNLKFFTRYSRFMSQGTCWEVQAIDKTSMTNVIEVNAKENFKDTFKDSDEIVNELVPDIFITPGVSTISNIKGDSLIRFYEESIFTDELNEDGKWIVSDLSLVNIIYQDKEKIILSGKKAGRFTLSKINIDDELRERELRVDSLF